ncbi:unnamed protein product [Diatraea saccharalis]|uniref:Histone deacetylase n=1 Tax=Diatraea saccharalis TaxID=40085 RepID=A0A9N9WH12_9NEOP|nr:unnamed protein product [Diatraea saccharalis]
MISKRVSYICDDNLINQCNRLPAVAGRASMVHKLIDSYGLTKSLKIVRPTFASYHDLRKFHSELYVDYLKSIKEIDDDYMANAEDEEHGIGYDCPPVSNMFDLVSTIAGASITAARCLVFGIADVAINWCGGWHHAQRFAADGFCYINDIVLAIETLQQKFHNILYIDLDIHHGNGVQDAYNLSKSVFTLSFHKYEPGFYPGTGGLDDIGLLSGKGYSCNFPLHAWYSDETIDYAFGQIFPDVFKKFKPDAIVVQCGADALAHDPQGGAKLTTHGYHSCLTKIIDMDKPVLVLGGGGYKFPNAARLWTSLTALLLGVSLDENIPEHDYWTQYGPDYTLVVEPMLTKDTNKKDYLDQCINIIKENLNYINIKPLEAPTLKEKKNDLESCDKKAQTDSIFKRFKSNLTKNQNNDMTQLDVYEFLE